MMPSFDMCDTDQRVLMTTRDKGILVGMLTWASSWHRFPYSMGILLNGEKENWRRPIFTSEESVGSDRSNIERKMLDNA
uniref:Uncharacterized protein n=1 Tax=Pristionchus pacificus TaxID=54126 RepID=A0A2A6CHY7_PRIPA|eukprot:PDM77673.1 hypothetical protein PRIPAC_34540 [Pristionchus pacificus]